MEGLEVFRAYYIALHIKPQLPEKRLFSLLPKLNQELLQTAVTNGVGSGVTNMEELLQVAQLGDIGITPTVPEFKAIIANMLQATINGMDISLDVRMDLQGRLANYFHADITEPEIVVGFDEDVPDTELFFTGFSPLDTILGEWQLNSDNSYVNNGIVPGVYTFQALEGAGKTYITQAIAHGWTGSVLFYECENGSKKIGKRKKTLAGVNLSNKKYVHGYYDIARIYDQLCDNPDPERLVVLDSIQSTLGNGQGPEDYRNYEKGYKYAKKMITEGLCKFIIMSTHLRAGTDGYSLDSVSASRVLSKQTDALISVKKLGALPNEYTHYEMYSVKNRDGVDGQRVTFSFRHTDGTVGKILTGGYS